MTDTKKNTKQKVDAQKLQLQIKDLEEKLLRSLADYSNLQKRIENQQQFFVTLATVGIINKMVDVLDDLRLTQKHLQDQGLQMVVDKFATTLKSEGLEEIEALNKEFNPETMECVGTCEGKDNIVTEIRKTGYKLNDQVIRPAQVVVSKIIKN